MSTLHRLLPLVLILALGPAVIGQETENPPPADPPAKPAAEPAAEEGATAIEEAIEDFEVQTRVQETVVTATRGPRAIYDLPRAVKRISRETLNELNPVQVVDALTRRDPGIVMDIRTATTGDPIMRGFAGFNIFTAIDGNTLSTLWGEGGFGADDMYGKVDPDTVAQIEVVRGPHSVLYGSNALGGVINFITRTSPIDYTEEGLAWGRRVKTTFFTNNDGFRTRMEIYGATPELKMLLGWSYANYNDARGGSGVGTLDPTSGRESNFDLRTDWLIMPGHELSLSILDVTRNDTHKFFRPTQDNENDRTGISLTWTADELAFVSPFTWRLYYQNKLDQRRFDIGSSSERHGFAETTTYSTDLQGSSRVADDHYLTYGVHAHVDEGQSPDDEQFTITQPKPRRADAPDSSWANYGFYVQDEWDVFEDLILTLAGRYDYFVFSSKETDAYRPPAGNRRLDFFRDTTGALTGGIGVTYKAAPDLRLLASYSRGFRQFAPNFGIRQLGNGVLIPNELLSPVTSNNYEVGARVQQRWFDADGFVYYSDISDWQALRPGEFQGSDWFDFNGNGTRDANEDVVTQDAVEDAYVWGIELNTSVYLSQIIQEYGADFPDGFSLWGGFAWNRGKVGDGEYFRHTQPARGLLGIRWDDTDPGRQAYFEFVTEMVNRYHRIPSDRAVNDLAYREDPQDKSKGLLRHYAGVPGYTVFSVYAGLNICENARLSVGVENITNKKFRRAHSRMDAFGINLIVGLDLTF